MRIVLVVLILLGMASTAARPTAVRSAEQAQGQETSAVEMTGPQVDLIKWAVTQGGLTLVLLLTLWSYRRDFFRKDEARIADIAKKEEDKREMQAILREVAAANQAQVIAVLQNTNATEKLSASVDRFAERRARRDGELT